MQITSASILNKGSREKNEDYIGSYRGKDINCFMLADGLGGHGSGEIAARIAVEEAKRSFYQVDSLEQAVRRAFYTGQEVILEHQRTIPQEKDMKTTEVLLAITENTVLWGHIGDSRLYYFRGSHMVKRTRDHSVPQQLAALGEIREREIRHHPDRNRLLRVMGTEWNQPQYELAKPIRPRRKQSFLLCSDGFWELVEESEMMRQLRAAETVEAWLSAMEQTIKRNGAGQNMDNYSAIGVWIR